MDFFTKLAATLPLDQRKELHQRLRLNLHNLRQLKRRFANDPVAIKLISQLEEVHQYGENYHKKVNF